MVDPKPRKEHKVSVKSSKHPKIDEKLSKCSSPYVEISDNKTCSSGLINSANNYAPNSLMMMSSSNAQYYPSWFIMQEIKPNHGCSFEDRPSNSYGVQIQESGRLQLPVNEANATAIAVANCDDIAETSKTINNYIAYCNLQLSATCVQKIFFYGK
ncbi:hypothetical protein A2U01_0023250 [Trifolium medium]|uniref:Uncharacterized protein n=1 Tax=Trifolium medium TaxID=97028 RepID=A0A392NQR5_9FABA|nr:hypothetical protein [Trifolium medium]